MDMFVSNSQCLAGCLPTLWNDDDRSCNLLLLTTLKAITSRAMWRFYRPRWLCLHYGSYRRCNQCGRSPTFDWCYGRNIASHPAVAECAVVGIADELRGQRPVGFACTERWTRYWRKYAWATKHRFDSWANRYVAFRNTILVKRLPKTRSGKNPPQNYPRSIADG